MAIKLVEKYGGMSEGDLAGMTLDEALAHLSADVEMNEELIDPNSEDNYDDISVVEDAENDDNSVRVEGLEDMDLSSWEIVPVVGHGQADKYLELFLPATKADFSQTGVGEYACILKFWFNRPVNDEDVRLYLHRVRCMLSRLRKSHPSAPSFTFVLVDHEILPDKKHVLVSCARMAPASYAVFLREHKAMLAQKNNKLKFLEGLL